MLALILSSLVLAGCGEKSSVINAGKIAELQASAAPAEHEWRHYLGDQASSQYSPLGQINRENVSLLQEAWRYDPQDAGINDTLIPTNPLVVKGVLYGLSARKNAFALDAATGELLWEHTFDRPHEGKGAGRGLVYWSGSNADQRILVGLGHELFALDATTGTSIKGFGNNGRIDLREGLDRPIEDIGVSVIAPGTVYKDLLIQGFGTSETYGAAPGYIRAYHIPGGELRWTFRTIPASGEYGSETWPEGHREGAGGANSWAGIAVDVERGLAFVPTGSAADDFYGANRAGDNLFANSLIALDAGTGERVWHYQIVRHDLWDRDLPSPPNLITLERNGEMIPAVSQATKSGHLFVFHRETGQPLFPIEEVPTQGEGVPGEFPPHSQPLPLAPPPLTRQRFEVTDRDLTNAAYVQRLTAGMRHSHPYMIPDEAGIIVYPGLDGGAEWGGQAWDPGRGLLYINVTEAAWFYRMVPTTQTPGEMTLQTGYKLLCAGCHRMDRSGTAGIFPSLRNIGEQRSIWETYKVIRDGRGRMPGFSAYGWYVPPAMAWYLHHGAEDGDPEDEDITPPGNITGYSIEGYNPLRDMDNLPGSKPPWGALAAVDVNRGEIAWKIPLGDYPEARAMGLSGLGAENYGGPVVTAGGLVFIGATPDSRFRAFDKDTGNLLWETTLPAAGFATPAVYEAKGRQFIVIAAGGGKLEQASGSAWIAYALPSPEDSAE